MKLGIAYHGNRMLHHAREDMRDIAEHGMNLVVHMLTHTDMDRNKQETNEAMQRIRGFERDRILAENRTKYKSK